MLLQYAAPAPAGVDQFRFVAITWPPGSVNDDRLEFFRAQDRAAAVRRKVIVIVGEHRRAVQVFAGGTDAQDLGFLMADRFAQAIFRRPRAQAPEFRPVAQLGFAFIDIEINRPWRCAIKNDAVVSGGLEISSPVAAGGATAERAAR